MRFTLRVIATSGAAVVGAVAALCAEPLGFLGSRTYAVGSTLGDVELADLDGDGALDLVAVRSGPSYTCTVQWGDGDGAFGAPQTISTGLSYALEAEIADVDDDGDLDVVRWGVAPVIDENLGGRTFLQRAMSPDIGFWKVASGADFDGDGDVDFAGIGQSSDFHFAENDGSGTFTAHRLVAPTWASGQVADWMDAGDLDGDGDPDLAIVYRNTGTVRLFLGDGAGDFAETAPLAIGGSVRPVVVTDLDGDGDDDVAATGTQASPPAATPYVVVLHRQDAGVGLVPWTTVGLQSSPTDLDAADVDGDGRTDLVATTSDFEILLRDDSGFTAQAPVPPAAAFPTRGAVGDLDGDGRADLVDIAYGAVGVLLQSALPPPRPTSVSPAVLREPATVDLELRGSGFGIGATVLGPPDLPVTSVSRVSDDVLTARLTVPAHAGSGDRTLTVRNPDGKTSATTVTLRSLDVAAVTGELRDRARGRRDGLHVSGTLAFNGLAKAPAFAAPLHDLTVRVGEPAAPIEFTVTAGDPRWRYVRGKQTWRGSRQDARLELVVDNERGAVDVRVSRFAFVAPPSGTVRLEVVVEGVEDTTDSGVEDRTWTPGGRRHTYVLRP